MGWVPTFGEANSPDELVLAFAEFDDGAGAALYVGGVFTQAGGQNLNSIARWKDGAWSPLGLGTNGLILALAASGQGSAALFGLYASGTFTTAGGVPADRIARWDGNGWSALGEGMNGDVYSLLFATVGSETVLFAGGAFIHAGGVPVFRVAKWDGDQWFALGEGLPGLVRALEVFDDGTGPALYAGGSFDTFGHVARWDGSAWTALGSGVGVDGDQVRALAVHDDGTGGGPALFVAGNFTSIGGTSVNRIAKWNGVSWSGLGQGLNSQVRALATFDDGAGEGSALYAAGDFGLSGSVPVNSIARWNGASWSALGDGVDGGSLGLGTFDDGTSSAGIAHGPSLFVGGWFIASPAGDVHIAKWGRSSEAVLSSSALTTGSTGGATQALACALTAILGEALVLDDPGSHLLLEDGHVAPAHAPRWLAGTIELRGGVWRQEEPLVLGVAGPARLVLADDARVEVPRLILGAQGELAGAGSFSGTLESQGRVLPEGPGLVVVGDYIEAPPATLLGERQELGARIHLVPRPVPARPFEADPAAAEHVR